MVESVQCLRSSNDMRASSRGLIGGRTDAPNGVRPTALLVESSATGPMMSQNGTMRDESRNEEREDDE